MTRFTAEQSSLASVKKEAVGGRVGWRGQHLPPGLPGPDTTFIEHLSMPGLSPPAPNCETSALGKDKAKIN